MQYASRDIEENLVRSAYLKKLNKLSRRWFVLYGASSINSAMASPSSSEAAEVSTASPAHLEWHNSEAKWRAKEPPKRVIVLKVRKGTTIKDVRTGGVTHSVAWASTSTTKKMPSDNI